MSDEERDALHNKILDSEDFYDHVEYTYNQWIRDQEEDIKLVANAWVDCIVEGVRKDVARIAEKAKKKVEALVANLPEGTVSVYELTLTTDKDEPQYLVDSFKKIVDSKMNGVISYKSCIELTKAGLPHIHAVIYSSKKTLDSSKIKRWYKYRFELQKVRSHDAYINYIMKEKNNPIVIEYCKNKKIDQFIDHALLPEKNEL